MIRDPDQVQAIARGDIRPNSQHRLKTAVYSAVQEVASTVVRFDLHAVLA